MTKRLNKFKPLILPSNESELDGYISKNSIKLMETILSSIEYALNKKMSVVEIFKFKNSDFVITLNSKNFEENVQNIDHIIPTFWVRGGMSSRSVIRNVDYLKSCGFKK